jgi:cytochrome c peroxidase
MRAPTLGRAAFCIASLVFALPVFAQLTSSAAPPTVPASVKASELDTSGPSYFAAHYRHMMRMPLPATTYNQTGFPATIEQFEVDIDPQGQIGSYQPAGPTTTASNAFFQSLGTNGRACITCHQPASGMSISLNDINERFRHYGTRDPLFAPVDGSTCPKNVPAANTKGAPVGGYQSHGTASLADAYKTLLQRGLLRIAIPLNAPPRVAPSAATTEFTIAVVSDPYGCNTDPQFNQDEVDGQPVIDPDTGKPLQIISIYRRPRISASLNFATTAFTFPGPPTNPTPAAASGNIMWDGREPTLASQARDATLGHAQAKVPPTAAQVQQIVAFETGFFSAQYTGPHDLELTNLALGGPLVLSAEPPGQHTPPTTFALYSAWLSPPGSLSNKAQRESIARGEVIFNTRAFQITNDAGINALPTPSKPSAPIAGSCSTCHSQKFSGNDTFVGAQQDQGIGGSSTSFGGPAPSPFLPIFKITCKPGVTLGFHGATIETNDPGLALITGKCADVGKLTVPQLRGLASRPPFFSDGSAATLLDVVNFYDKRFSINLTPAEKQDLVNFLDSL